MLIINVLIFNLVIALSYTCSTMAILFTKFCVVRKSADDTHGTACLLCDSCA